MDQNSAPLLEAVADYHAKNRYGFSPPAHRQGRGIDPLTLSVLGKDPFRDDMLASGGLDDRSSSNSYLTTAEELMADAVGADSTFFSTCGSSLSVKAAMLAVTGVSGGLLIGRDVHKSVVSGLVLSGLQPYWMSPQWDDDLKMSHPPSPEQVEAGFDRHPDAAGALIVSPTPYGTCADIAAIAKICHKRGKPLIIDEAWGAHLPFHKGLPTWAMNAGADVCVVSVHKMGLGFEQGSVYHVQGDLIDPAHLSACADLLMTTSPNVLIYSAMDGWRRHMVQNGEELLGAALQLAERVRSGIDQLPGLHVLKDELIRSEASHELDFLRPLVDVSQLGISGYQAVDWMREHHNIDVGMSDHRRFGFDLSIADDEFTAGRLLVALADLTVHASDLPAPPRLDLRDPEELELEVVDLPRDAFFGECEMVPIEEAVGRIAGEMATPYPPGIPAFLPGERLNQTVIDYLRSGLEMGMNLPDVADASLDTVRVRKL
jgi:arginine decarboxylase